MIVQNEGPQRRPTQESNSSRSVMLDQQVKEKPCYHPFLQQTMKTYLPIPSLCRTITVFFIMATVFLSFGIPMLTISRGIVQVKVDYDELCFSSPCNVPFQITQKMTGPVFVYYQLQNFYQNHRLYIKSINYDQLGGNTISVSDAQSSCQPIVTNADVYKTTSITGATLDPTAPANPCGMVAYSVFNDTYEIKYGNGTNISAMTTDQIGWPSDHYRYQMPDPSVMWLNTSDPRVRNWMRISTLPTFRKLWARINLDLQVGNYILTVENNYALNKFNAKKYFVLSNSSVFGSKNNFLAIVFLSAGCASVLIGAGFLARKCKKNSKIQHRGQ